MSLRPHPGAAFELKPSARLYTWRTLAFMGRMGQNGTHPRERTSEDQVEKQQYQEMLEWGWPAEVIRIVGRSERSRFVAPEQVQDFSFIAPIQLFQRFFIVCHEQCRCTAFGRTPTIAPVMAASAAVFSPVGQKHTRETATVLDTRVLHMTLLVW